MSELVAQIIGVTKVYQKNKAAPPVRALRGIDLDVPKGQYLSIMGPSGSGKSTLMNVIGCLDRPTEGQYLLGGTDVASMEDTELSRARGRHLGFVFQAFNLIPQLTVQENVAVPLFYQGVPKAERNRRAAAVLDRVELSERMSHRPGQLSGGQMQRVAIARALVNEPSILLADEPTGNLDTKTGDTILALFDELHEQGLTIVMVTHDPGMADRCERVIRLRDGLIDVDEPGGKAGAVAGSSAVG
ncbi:MAG: ABC transporter ATP-binding protein [Phycisphaerales bacterium JB063]